MAAFLQTALAQIKEFAARRTRAQWIKIAAIAAGVIALIIVAVVLMSRVEYGVLYPDMPDSEASEVYSILKDNMGVNVSIRRSDTGTAILVPAAQVDDLRMRMSLEGYPKTGSGTTIFEKGTALGSTQAVQKAYENYQLQDTLANTLKTVHKVLDANVVLFKPDTSVFVLQSSKTRPTASVSLTLRAGETLTQREVNGIARLISTASSNIAPEDVTIWDNYMNYYTVADEEEATPTDTKEDLLDRIAIRELMQQSYYKQMRMLLSPMLGPEGTNYALSLDLQLDFDKYSQQTVEYEPPVPEAGNVGIIISMKELQETINPESVVEGEPGMDANGGAPVYPTEVTGSNAPYEKLEKEFNAEVNEQRTMLERAEGAVVSLSVSVGINADYIGEVEKQVHALLMNGLGIRDESLVSVERFPFYQEEGMSYEDYMAEYQAAMAVKEQNDLRNTIIIVLAIIAAFVIGLVLLRRFLRPPAPVMAEPEQEIIDVEEEEEPELALVVPDESIIKKNRDLERIEQLVDEDPEVVAQLLRSWLADDYR